MSLDILIIAHYCGEFDEKSNNRFNYLAELLSKQDYDVELVTSTFSHTKKTRRSPVNQEIIPFKVTLIEEPSYEKNVSFKRFYSNYIIGKNLKVYLEKRKKPDIIYCAVPSLDFAKVAADYANENNVRFIIDIQDLWPEAFKMVINVPLISNILFSPMKKKADYIYSSADEIVAVSKTYMDRGLSVNEKGAKGYSIYLGTDLDIFDNFAKQYAFPNKPDNEIWLVYIGTLGHSYDLSIVIEALNILNKQGVENLKFIVIGDGPLKSKFEQQAKKFDIYADFVGRLEYGKMVGLLTACDIAVNPIVQKSVASIINKHADYAAAGLPVINTQDSQEYRDLLTKYNAGLNSENDNAYDLVNKLLELYQNEALRIELGNNSRKMAEKLFDRRMIYSAITNIMAYTYE